MSDLADKTGSFCKLSGLVTEAGEGWTKDDLKPFTDHILEVFGPQRVMWGSDWPVCRLQSEYDAVYWPGFISQTNQPLLDKPTRLSVHFQCIFTLGERLVLL